MTSRGFTLIEVLVAAVLLFATLGAMTELLRTTLLSSGAAENAVAISQAAAELQPQITFQIEEGGQGAARQGGEGRHGFVRYRWRAAPLRQAERFVPLQESGAGTGATPVSLWNVTLEVEAGQRRRQFTFHALSWK